MTGACMINLSERLDYLSGRLDKEIHAVEGYIDSADAAFGNTR